MSENKRYYWLKLRRDFFKRHDSQIIESMENGKDYLLFYLKLLLFYMPDNGVISKNKKELSRNLDIKYSLVNKAIKIFIKYGLIKESGKYYQLTYIDKKTVYSSFEKTGRDRTTIDYKTWRLDVFKRDNFTCQSCGLRGTTLNAHHIKKWAKYPQLRFNVSNGVTLCVKCHKLIHQLEGK